jgi:hypothetical protein
MIDLFVAFFHAQNLVPLRMPFFWTPRHSLALLLPANRPKTNYNSLSATNESKYTTICSAAFAAFGTLGFVLKKCPFRDLTNELLLQKLAMLVRHSSRA